MTANIYLKPRSRYGKDKVISHGNLYSFVKIVEDGLDGDFLVLLHSVKDNSKLMVKLESDKDFKVMMN